MGRWIHRLTDVDLAARTAVCAACGPVTIVKKSASRWVCSTKERTRKKKQQRGANYEPPHPGRCPICGRDALLVWDHDHQTGEGRGHICPKCNSALAMMDDNPAALRAAAMYLETTKVAP